MDWKQKKVLVTGAGGFIGSHLCEALLDQGASVKALIRYSSRSDWGNLEYLSPEKKNQINVVAGNIEDAHFVAREMRGQDILFHLAALIGIPYSYHAPLSYVRTNVEGTLNVLEAARSCGVERVIHTSTSETYGTALYTPIDEKHPLQGQSPYSASKIGADKIAESFYLSFGLPITILRPFNTYGPRQSARAVIPTIISQALTQGEIRLGALNPVRDFTYVKDTASGFIRAAEAAEAVGQTVNIGYGKGITIEELVKIIFSLLQMEKPVVHDAVRSRPEKSEVYMLICNHAKARELMGWQTRYSFESGLQETIEFITRHLHHYKPERYAL